MGFRIVREEQKAIAADWLSYLVEAYDCVESPIDNIDMAAEMLVEIRRLYRINSGEQENFLKMIRRHAMLRMIAAMFAEVLRAFYPGQGEMNDILNWLERFMIENTRPVL